MRVDLLYLLLFSRVVCLFVFFSSNFHFVHSVTVLYICIGSRLAKSNQPNENKSGENQQ